MIEMIYVPESSEVLDAAYEYEYSNNQEIEVTFTLNSTVIIRLVNNTGDVESFEQRVKEVALGVQNKVKLESIKSSLDPVEQTLLVPEEGARDE
jgi:hypothetical protein